MELRFVALLLARAAAAQVVAPLPEGVLPPAPIAVLCAAPETARLEGGELPPSLSERLDAPRPTGARVGTAFRQALSDPSLWPAAAAAAFDGAAPRAASLEALAAPWRTDLQLERLRSSPRGPGERFRFAVIGAAEPGFGPLSRLFRARGVFQRQLTDLARRPADFVVQLGDMVSLGNARRYARFFAELAATRLRIPYLTVPGNHDRSFPIHGDNRLYVSLFGRERTDYAFDRGPARFIVLDNSTGRLTPEQLAWLDDALDTPLLKLVFLHIPPHPLHALSKELPVLDLPRFEQGAEEFMEVVARRGVARVYMGHIHRLAQTVDRGVRYVLTGGGGSPLYPSGGLFRGRRESGLFHHYLMVEVGPEGVSETVHRTDGSSSPL